MRLEVQWNGLRDELSQSSMSEELHGKEKSQAIPASQQNQFMEAESFMHDRPSHVPAKIHRICTSVMNLLWRKTGADIIL